MSEIDTGGPAFPTFTNQYHFGLDEQRPATVDPGMTLRDYFAAKASEEDIQEWVHVIPKVQRVFEVDAGRKEVRYVQPHNAREIARYMHADAMLKARQGGQA